LLRRPPSLLPHRTPRNDGSACGVKRLAGCTPGTAEARVDLVLKSYKVSFKINNEVFLAFLYDLMPLFLQQFLLHVYPTRVFFVDNAAGFEGTPVWGDPLFPACQASCAA